MLNFCLFFQLPVSSVVIFLLIFYYIYIHKIFIIFYYLFLKIFIFHPLLRTSQQKHEWLLIICGLSLSTGGFILGWMSWEPSTFLRDHQMVDFRYLSRDTSLSNCYNPRQFILLVRRTFTAAAVVANDDDGDFGLRMEG